MNTNKHTALSGLETSIKTASDLENNRYKNQAALRNSHDDDADFFNDIGNAVIGPSGRPRGIGANLAYGVSKGLAHGAKSKSTAEKKDNYDKHANVANYLQNLQGEVVKQNQWYEQEERRMETVKPFAVGGLEVAYSGMPYETGNERMRNVVEQAKIADPRIKGDYIGYVPNSPIINMRDKDGNIVAFSLSNLVGEDVVKRVQENYIAQQKVDTEKKYAPVKYASMTQRQESTDERVRQMAQKTFQAAQAKYAPKIEAAARVQVVAHKIEKLVEKFPGMGQSVLRAVWHAEEENPSALNLIAKKFTNGADAEAIVEMGKLIKELKIGVIKGLTNPNMSIDMLAAGTIAGQDFPDKSIIKVVRDISNKAKYEMEMNKEYLNSVKGAFGEEFNGGDKYAGMAQDYIDESTSESPLASFGKRVV